MSYRYLGYGITDSNGEAKLEYDENGNHLDHSITGTGAGELDIVASLDKPIGSGSIVSETYEIIDATYYDDGVTSPKTKTWYNQDNAFSVSIDDTGTLLSCSASSLKSFFADGTNWSSSSKFTAPLCVEVDIESVTGSDVVLAILSNVNPTISLTGRSTVKMIWDGSKVEKYIDGVLTGTTQNVTQTPVAIGFRMTTGSVKYKNFKIYPI